MNINERGCWIGEKSAMHHFFDEGLAKELSKLCNKIPMVTVVDIGCGDGTYVAFLNDNGALCVGYDGSPSTDGIDYCSTKDFSEPQGIGRYDVVLSLEVGEHIPAEYEQTFLDNLVHPEPDMIILSWAVEGQAGQGHVNCRNNDYIIAEMGRRAYGYLPELSQTLRDVSRLPWFKNTIMVFDLMPF